MNLSSASSDKHRQRARRREERGEGEDREAEAPQEVQKRTESRREVWRSCRGHKQDDTDGWIEGRKGTAWAVPLPPFQLLDPGWFERRCVRLGLLFQEDAVGETRSFHDFLQTSSRHVPQWRRAPTERFCWAKERLRRCWAAAAAAAHRSHALALKRGSRSSDVSRLWHFLITWFHRFVTAGGQVSETDFFLGVFCYFVCNMASALHGGM